MLPIESNMALKVAITGIDGAGKSTTLSNIIGDLATDNRIVKATNRPVYSVVEGGKQYHYRHLISLIDKLHGIADKTGNPNYVCAVNAFHVVLQGRVIEPTLIQRIKPTLVLGARDLLVDPSVYAIFYSPQLATKGMAERIDLLAKLTGANMRDIIFFLTVSPDEAVRRIEERIKDEKETLASIERAKWRHMHENPKDLERLQLEYSSALEEVCRRAPTQVVEIDTSRMTQQEVGNYIKTTIRSHLNARSLGRKNPKIINWYSTVTE